MSSPSPASLLDVRPGAGKPPVLRVDATGDAPSWAAEHREALRAVVAEHGSVLVRGLGLRDAAETGAVFQRLATGLMTEREAFASRQTYADGVYSATKWPPNQPMCMHHELSYTLEFPGLMLFACLSRAHRRRGDRAWPTRRPCSTRCPPSWSSGSSGRAGCSPAATTTRSGRPSPRRSAPRTGRRRALLPRQRDRVRLAARRWAAHQAAPQRRGAPPGHRPALLVQPDRVPQRVDDGPRGARVPGGRLRRRRAAVQHPLRERRPDRRGRRGAAQQGLRGQHRPRAVAGRRPAARRQRPHRAQPGALRGTARGAGRDGRPGAPGRLLADRRGDRR